MIIFAITAMLAVAADPPPPPAMTEAAGAWNACLQAQVEASDRSLRPRRIADAVILACAPQQEAMLAAHREWVAGSTLSERDRRAAIRTMETSVAGMGRMLEMLVRSDRD